MGFSALLGSTLGLEVMTGNLMLFGGLMVVELVVLGWSGSSFRRLVTGGRSAQNDLFYATVAICGLLPMLITLMAFGFDRLWDHVMQALPWKRLEIDLPLLPGVLLLMLVQGLGLYGMHRLLHRRGLWPLHAVHHAAREMTVLTTLRVHPLEHVLYNMFSAALAIVLGFSPEMTSLYILVNAVQTAWQHSNLPAPWPWVEQWVLAGPRYHRIHHARDEALHDSNFSDYPLIDRAFGTYRWTNEWPDIGLPAENGLYNSGFVPTEIVRVQADWLSRLASRLKTFRTRET